MRMNGHTGMAVLLAVIPVILAAGCASRGHWFYIDAADSDSKLAFNVLITLFSLQTGVRQASQPLLTLPVG